MYQTSVSKINGCWRIWDTNAILQIHLNLKWNTVSANLSNQMCCIYIFNVTSAENIDQSLIFKIWIITFSFAPLSSIKTSRFSDYSGTAISIHSGVVSEYCPRNLRHSPSNSLSIPYDILIFYALNSYHLRAKRPSPTPANIHCARISVGVGWEKHFSRIFLVVTLSAKIFPIGNYQQKVWFWEKSERWKDPTRYLVFINNFGLRCIEQNV